MGNRPIITRRQFLILKNFHPILFTTFVVITLSQAETSQPGADIKTICAEVGYKSRALATKHDILLPHPIVIGSDCNQTLPVVVPSTDCLLLPWHPSGPC